MRAISKMSGTTCRAGSRVHRDISQNTRKSAANEDSAMPAMRSLAKNDSFRRLYSGEEAVGLFAILAVSRAVAATSCPVYPLRAQSTPIAIAPHTIAA